MKENFIDNRIHNYINDDDDDDDDDDDNYDEWLWLMIVFVT